PRYGHGRGGLHRGGRGLFRGSTMTAKLDVYLCFYDRFLYNPATVLDDSIEESIQVYSFTTVEDAILFARGIDEGWGHKRICIFWNRAPAERHVEACQSRITALKQQPEGTRGRVHFAAPTEMIVEANGESPASEKKRLFAVFGLDETVDMNVELHGAEKVIHDYPFSTEHAAREFMRALQYSLDWLEYDLFLSREEAERFLREELAETAES